jgi:hypothetical protein
MKTLKKARISSGAQQDLAAAAHYYGEVAPHMLDAFFDAFDKAIGQIERQPAKRHLKPFESRSWNLQRPCKLQTLA